MDTSYPRTNDTPPQMEPPVFSDGEGADSAALEASESSPSAQRMPRQTLPLPRPDGRGVTGPVPVVREHALVATDRRGGLPMSPVAPPAPAARWWSVVRPGTFWLTLMPILLGAATVWLAQVSRFSTVFHPIRLLALALVALALHAGANLLNQYYDLARGTDGQHAPGSSRIMYQGLLSARGVRNSGFLLLALGTLGLLILALATHVWGVFLLGVVALALAYLYSGTRYALGYFPLSELIVGFVMGPALVFASVQLQGAQANPTLAMPFAFALGSLAAAVMLANNLRDIETDRAANKRTLVTFIGAQMGRALYLALVLLPYLLIALVAFKPGTPHGLLLVLLTIPGLFVVITGILRAETPAASNVVVAQTLRLHVRFSFLLLIGYLLSVGVAYLLSLFR